MGLIGKFASVGSATSASRVLGFVREAMIAATLGAGPVTDAFYAAFRFPNLFRRLFAEGAFNSAFVPLFAKEVEDGEENAAAFAGEVFASLCVILLVLTLIAVLFMPFLVGTVIAPGFADTPGKFELTTHMARIMFPYLAFMSLVAMISGMLNAYRRYFLAAFAPVLLNVVLIAVLSFVGWRGVEGATAGLFLAWGVVAAGLLQLGTLIYGLARSGFSFRLRRPGLSSKVRRLLALAAPAALTGGIVQINIVVGQIIASQQDKAISWLSWADRVYQLPLGVIGIAIGVVLLPELARALRAGDHEEALSLQNKSLEFGLALTIPAAVALAIIPAPIVAVLYERGAFDAASTAATAAALGGFALGLPAFVLIKILQPAFFAREDMRTPMWAALVSLVANAVGSLAMFPYLGHVGIALATSIAGWVNAVVLGVILWRSGDFRPAARSLSRIMRSAGAAAVMGLALWGWTTFVGDLFDGGNIVVRGALLGFAVIGAMIIYFALALATGGMDRSALMRTLRRRRA